MKNDEEISLFLKNIREIDMSNRISTYCLFPTNDFKILIENIANTNINLNEICDTVVESMWDISWSGAPSEKAVRNMVIGIYNKNLLKNGKKENKQ